MSNATFTTRNAAGKSFSVRFWGGKSAEFPRGHWEVTITDDATQLQDHGNFCLLDTGLFGLEGLEFTDTDDVVMIQGEIARDLLEHGELGSTFTYHDEDGTTQTIDATNLDDAAARAESLCRQGDWGTYGACITVWVTEEDATGQEINRRDLTVDIEPDHEHLIREAGGNPECDHEWTSAGEGGCSENPGVWSTGGTALTIATHCRICGLRRVEHKCGSQRNPGEHDRVVYTQGKPDIETRIYTITCMTEADASTLGSCLTVNNGD